MFLYFYLLDQAFYEAAMAPALASSVRHKSFAPCLDLCRFVLKRNPGIPQDALVRAVLAGLPFERAFWHGLIGECLVHGAAAIPRVPTAADTFCCLLAPDRVGKPDTPRADYAPIQQAHFGTRDLMFGLGFFRPDHAGLNDAGDVSRLAGYLAGIDPAAWTAAALAPLTDCADDAERAEELAYARDCWPSLVELYQDARDRNWVVVCERM